MEEDEQESRKQERLRDIEGLAERRNRKNRNKSKQVRQDR